MALKIGLQLYSVKEAMADNPLKTIREVAQIGYKNLELANLNAETDYGCGFHATAGDLKKAADDCGCNIFSAHIDPLTDRNIDPVLEYHAELGTKYLMSKPFSCTREGALKDCELYNRLGEKCRKFGIQHCLHTGLAPFLDDGSWLLDVLFSNTDPQNMAFEVDAYWMMRSAFDPKEVIEKFADRIIAVHQKDLPKDFHGNLNVNQGLGRGRTLDHANFFDFVQKEDFCEIGTGQMDIQGIIDTTIARTNAGYIILEQDYTAHTEMESIKISLENLKKYKNVEA